MSPISVRKACAFMGDRPPMAFVRRDLIFGGGVGVQQPLGPIMATVEARYLDVPDADFA